MDYKAILEMFTAKRPTRSKYRLSYPTTRNGWTTATDGVQLCRVPSSVFEVEHTDGPDSDAVFRAESDAPAIRIPVHLLKPKKLEALVAKIPDLPEEPDEGLAECSSCDGSGECTCVCSDIHDCGDCEGTGEVGTESAAHREWTKLSEKRKEAIENLPYVCFAGATFNYLLFRNIPLACEKAGLKEIEFKIGGEWKVATARAGDFSFALMPIRSPTKTNCVEIEMPTGEQLTPA